jgi:hypothetical protein
LKHDILDIQKSGFESVQANATVKIFFEDNKYKKWTEKCHQMQFEKNCKCCPNLTLHYKTLHQLRDENYLGYCFKESFNKPILCCSLMWTLNGFSSSIVRLFSPNFSYFLFATSIFIWIALSQHIATENCSGLV